MKMNLIQIRISAIDQGQHHLIKVNKIRFPEL